MRRSVHIATLSKNPIKVILGYFIIPDFLPWTGNYQNFIGHNFVGTKDYEILKTAWKNPNIETVKVVIFETNIETKKIVMIRLLNFLSFLILILVAFFRTDLKMRLVLMCSFFAPLSWFIIANESFIFSLSV